MYCCSPQHETTARNSQLYSVTITTPFSTTYAQPMHPANQHHACNIIILNHCLSVTQTLMTCTLGKRITKWMMPAPVSQTAMKMEHSCARRMLEEVLSTLRYCRISGTDISRSARRNLSPVKSWKSERCKTMSNFIRDVQTRCIWRWIESYRSRSKMKNGF